MHQDEILITTKSVRQLVDSQFPEFADLPLQKLSASGSSNVQFRLGADWLVRLPRQPNSSATIEKEACWTPVFGRSLPVAVPRFVGVGQPDFGYSERWSILHWLDGQSPIASSLEHLPDVDRRQLAGDLADVILAVRTVPVPAGVLTDASLRNYRGRSLAAYDKQMRRNIEQCRSIAGLDLDLDAAHSLWEQALDESYRYDTGLAQWYHADLVAENLLLTDNRLTGVLDFGALGIGDPTIDLHGAWELFDAPARDVFRLKIGASDGEWLRGRAWALAVALMTFPYYWHSMPGRVNDRLVMAQAVLADAD